MNREKKSRMALSNLEVRTKNPAIVDAKRMKAVVFSPTVMVVLMH